MPMSWRLSSYHVRADGTGDASTIQAGLDSAAIGDTVRVGPGTYLENIDFRGKDCVLVSEMGALETIIDGSDTVAPVVTFENGEGAGAELREFTLTNGSGKQFGEGGGVGWEGFGGGVFIFRSCPRISVAIAFSAVTTVRRKLFLASLTRVFFNRRRSALFMCLPPHSRVVLGGAV